MCKKILSCILLFASMGSSADTLTPPTDLEIGANFVWYLTNVQSVDELRRFPEALVRLDKKSQANASGLIETLSELRQDIVPRVDLVGQNAYSIDLGEQIATYRLYSKSEGSIFVEVKILGLDNPPTIATIKSLSLEDVFNDVAREKIFSFPQK